MEREILIMHESEAAIVGHDPKGGQGEDAGFHRGQRIGWEPGRLLQDSPVIQLSSRREGAACGHRCRWAYSRAENLWNFSSDWV